MKDEYLRDVLIKLLIAIIIFTVLIIGICVYMFMPDKKSKEKVVIDDSSEIVNNTEMINNIDNSEVVSEDVINELTVSI